MVREFENHRVNVREQITAPFNDPHEIARTQLVRFRRRLGTLTLDQEVQIQDLLISTVTKISSITGRLLESLDLELCKEPRGNLKITRPANGISGIRLTTNDGPIVFTGKDHHDSVEAFSQIAQDRDNNDH